MARKPRKSDIGDQFGLASDPRRPAPWDSKTAYAIKALYEGKATEHQQQIITHWLDMLTGRNDLEFRDDDRMSAFASGKRFVGLQLRKLATLHPDIIEAAGKTAASQP